MLIQKTDSNLMFHSHFLDLFFIDNDLYKVMHTSVVHLDCKVLYDSAGGPADKNTTAHILTGTNKYKNIFLVLPNSDVEILLTDFKAFNGLAQDRLILIHVPMCLLRTVNGAVLVIPRSQLSYWAFC